ncbi:hypothetical protein HN954_02635 [bacterium]|jgi:hypothetical protein|nr:hypothetical protein [bacterium]MBT6831655.1 hypothetical protein [bacterium]MBT6996301.1 hypothetical protein [bacterium]MBT7772979.1 hypothetical protein [bacterium]
MKRFLALVLATVVLAAGMIFLSEASQYRPHSDRISPYRYLKDLRAKYQPQRSTQPAQTYEDLALRLKLQREKQFSRSDYSLYRSMHPDLFPRNKNIVQTQKNYVRASDDFRETFVPQDFEPELETIAREKYSLGVLSDFEEISANKFYHPKSDLLVSVKEFEGTCNATSFRFCAITNGKHIRRGRDLTTPRGFDRSFVLKKMFHDGQILFYPAESEAYFVNDHGIDKTYIVTQFLNPVDGSITYLEGETSEKNAMVAKNLMHSLALSFQFQY